MENLKLLRDNPAFNKGAKDFDAFNHEAFANVLLKVIKDNAPPLTIGLFGGWGVGKSSIVNLIMDKSKTEMNKYSFVYFNAWTHSGDSMRRQLLLTMVNDIIEDEVKKTTEKERMRKLNYAKILDEEAGISPFETLRKAKASKEYIKELTKAWNEIFSNIKFSHIGVAQMLILFLVFLFTVVFAWIGFENNNEFLKYLGGIGGVSFLMGLFKNFAPKIENIFVLKRREVFDARLIFPEQFEDEFNNLIKLYAEDKEKVIFIIDDLDRCDSQVIKDVLVTLKNYLSTNEKTIFLVPMDDSSVVRIFKEGNTNFGYEQLRKYFNISLRIPSIHEEDLIEFAKRNAIEYNIPQEVVFIAALGYCTDARKMKHFLNLYKLKFAIALERENTGHLMNLKTAEQQSQIAKIVILEYQWPDFYRMISQYPEELEKITDAARGSKIEDFSSLKSISPYYDDIQVMWKENIGLKVFLARTYDTPIDNFDILSKLKGTFQEVFLSELGVQIRRAITEGIEIDFEKFEQEQNLLEKSDSIVDSVIKYFDEDNDIISKRVINICLNLLDRKILSNDAHKRLLKESVKFIVNSNINFEINGTNYRTYLNNFELLPHKQKSEISNKFERDLFSTPGNFKNFDELINHEQFCNILSLNENLNSSLNQNTLDLFNLAKELKAKTDIAQRILDIRYTNEERVKMKFNYPDKNILSLFLSLLADKKLSDPSYDKLLLDNILNENNNVSESIMTETETKVKAMMENNITVVPLNEIMFNAFRLFTDSASWFPKKIVLEIYDQIIANYANFTLSKDRNKLLQFIAVCYASLISSSPTDAETIKKQYLIFLNQLNWEELTFQLTLINEIKHYNEDKFKSLISDGFQNIMNSTIVKTFNTNDDGIKKKALLLLKNKDYLNNNDFVNFIVLVINSNDLGVLNFWEDFTDEYFKICPEEQKEQIVLTFKNKFLEVGISNEYRISAGKLMKKYLVEYNVNEGQIILNDLLGNFVSDEDNIVLEFVNDNFDWLKGRFSEKLLHDNINNIIRVILEKNDRTNLENLVKKFQDYFSDLNQENLNLIGEKILLELPDETKGVEDRKLLLKLGALINTEFEKKEELAKVLHEYKDNGENSDIKKLAKELYKSLRDRRIIQKYNSPKPPENEKSEEEVKE